MIIEPGLFLCFDKFKNKSELKYDKVRNLSILEKVGYFTSATCSSKQISTWVSKVKSNEAR